MLVRIQPFHLCKVTPYLGVYVGERSTANPLVEDAPVRSVPDLPQNAGVAQLVSSASPTKRKSGVRVPPPVLR